MFISVSDGYYDRKAAWMTGSPSEREIDNAKYEYVNVSAFMHMWSSMATIAAVTATGIALQANQVPLSSVLGWVLLIAAFICPMTASEICRRIYNAYGHRRYARLSARVHRAGLSYSPIDELLKHCDKDTLDRHRNLVDDFVTDVRLQGIANTLTDDRPDRVTQSTLEGVLTTAAKVTVAKIRIADEPYQREQRRIRASASLDAEAKNAANCELALESAQNAAAFYSGLAIEAD